MYRQLAVGQHRRHAGTDGGDRKDATIVWMVNGPPVTPVADGLNSMTLVFVRDRAAGVPGAPSVITLRVYPDQLPVVSSAKFAPSNLGGYGSQAKIK